MTGMDELEALAQSIGEHTIEAIGREAFSGIQVTVDRRNMSAQISILLADDSDDEQLRVIRQLFDVEQIFVDEVVISYSFVSAIAEPVEQRETIRQFSLV